jgi:hypothetical protein
MENIRESCRGVAWGGGEVRPPGTAESRRRKIWWENEYFK